MLAKGEKLPVDFSNRVIYYVGPVDPVRDEAVGPAGPTTATRMDKFTEMMLAQTGLIAMIGKSERGPVAIESIKKHKSARSEEHTSELQSLMRISYAVFCLKKKKRQQYIRQH